MEEKELKSEAESLAKIAVESGLGSKQLRAIYDLCRTKPLPVVEAYVQRQLGRDVSGKKGFEHVLGLLVRFREDKASFCRILWYANMVFDYFQKQYAMRYGEYAEAISRKACERFGCKYLGLETVSNGDLQELRVSVSGYVKNPKDLSSAIWRELTSKYPNFRGRVWIEQSERR